MEYNQELFGAKRTVFNFTNNVYTRLFEIGSQNISVQQGFDSGVFEKQAQLPADIALWEIGDESVLTRLTWRKKVDGQRVVHHSNDDKDRVKLMLSTNSAKVNATTFDVTSSSGNVYGRTAQCNYRNLVTQNNFNPLQQYPLWNPVQGLQGSAPHFSTQPFILDFDYSGVLLRVYVATGSTTMSLKQFLDSSNTGTRITALYVESSFGTATNHITASTTRFENETNNLYIQGIHLINSKTYDVPLDVRADLGMLLPSFIMASRPVTQFNISDFIWVIIDVSASTSSYRVSYYQDEQRIDELGIIPHGENDTYNQDDIDWMLKQIALLGFWFTTDDSNYQTRVTGENCTDENTYLPEIKDGITTGRYWAGREAANKEAAKWGDDWREKVNYQPGGGGSSDEGDKSSRATYETTLPSFGNIYFRDLDMIKYLAEDLNRLITDTQNPYDPSIFYGQNPVDCIIAIKEYPIDITPYIVYAGSPNPDTLMTVKLGRWLSNTHAYRVQIKTGGEPFAQVALSIPSSFKTIGYEFLDYEPYSSYHLYLPFCGTVKIPSEIAVDTNIEVLYYADILSGACIAHIYINNKYYCSAQGQLAVDIPFSGYQVSQYTMNMLNASYAQKQAYANLASDVGRLITGTGGSVIGMGINSKVGYGSSNPITITNPRNPADVLFSGTAGGLVNAGQVISGAGKAIQAGAAMASHYETIKYNKTILNHSAPAPIKSSLGGGIINWESPYYVEMLVERPTFMEGFDSNKYTQLVGKACHIADTLANHSGGYVEAINCNLSGFPATQPEKVELAKLLADGVFL